jgi:hypothetical protein
LAAPVADRHAPVCRRRRLETSLGRDHHLHRDVEARRRLRRDQPVAGFPDFQAEAALVRRTLRRCAPGATSIRRWPAWPNCARRSPTRCAALYGADYDVEDEITVTAGATQAIFTAIAAFVRGGDEVIVFEPVYDSYVPAIETVGGKAVYAALRFPGLPAGLGSGPFAAQPAHADDHHQLAAQPDRQPVRRRRSRSRWPN